MHFVIPLKSSLIVENLPVHKNVFNNKPKKKTNDELRKPVLIHEKKTQILYQNSAHPSFAGVEFEFANFSVYNAKKNISHSRQKIGM
jgi:hypothetical protein